MSWQAAVLSILALVLVGGFAWFERTRPSARIVAAVAALAALGVAGRVAFAPIPNVVATTDVALLAGYTLGGAPGFVVGALSGLVSNFWLGQGPWTPWQMAGWGLVGIAGALLARSGGRRLGRWGLAGVGAIAGLAYGALLDLSVMVNFGGEQSLDRYLALSARGIPFNVAHAAGNAALMLAAGPAMVRMLDRYRDRFEVRWSEVPLARAAAALALALCVALPLLSPQRSAADGRSGARAWLLDAQNKDGGFGSSDGEGSSVGMTGWAMLGLESAGINPADVPRPGGRTPISYLRANIGAITSTADLERTILAFEGAGVDSRDFAGRDLVARLRDRQADDGSFEHQVNLTAFAILAQRAADVPGPNFGRAAAWLRKLQNGNGGWGSLPDAESEPDSTGAVLQALAVSPGGDDEVERGGRWLGRSQHGDGGWSLTRGAEANTQSTAWAIQGLVAAGRNPVHVDTHGNSGLEFLAARQAADGHYRYSSGSDQTPVWTTAQALTAVNLEPFPIRAVKREPPPKKADDDKPPESIDPSGGSTPTPEIPTGGFGDDAAYDYEGIDGFSGGGGVGPSFRGGPAGKAPAKVQKKKKKDGKGHQPSMQSIPPKPKHLDRSDALTTDLAPAALTSEAHGDDAPSTPVLLGALALLAAALVAGFFPYRDRLP